MDHPYKYADYPFNLIHLDPEGYSWKVNARAGKYVEAIKDMRRQEANKGHTLGLKPAKDAVEAYVSFIRDNTNVRLDPIRINDRVSLHVTPDPDGGYNVQMVTTVAAGHASTLNDLMRIVTHITIQQTSVQ